MPPVALSSSTLRPAQSVTAALPLGALLPEIIDILAASAGTEGLRRELESLTGEADPELFAYALLRITERQIQAGNQDSVSHLIPALQRLTEAPSLSAADRRHLQSRLAAFQGQGTVGQRVEYHLQNFIGQAIHPAVLAGFAFGAGAYQGARLLTMSRLSAASATYFTRGVGARFLAGTAGWAAEVPALTLGSRGIRHLMGERVEWNATSVGHELAGSAITLGLMRLTGYGARRAFEGVHGLPAAGSSLRWSGAVPFSGPLFQQSAMLGSLMLAHGIESRLHLRPASDLGGNFADSLMTLLQFHVGGRIFHELQPRSFSRAVQAAEYHSQNLSGPRSSLPGFAALALEHPRLQAAGASTLDGAGIFSMSELPKRSQNPIEASAPAGRSSIAPIPFRFRNVVEELPDPVIVTDAAGRIIFLNRSAREIAEGSSLSWLQGTMEEYFHPVEGEEGVVTFSKGSETSYWRLRSREFEEQENFHLHQLSDHGTTRHLQEIAARAEMKANLAEGLVHDAGNLVAIAYQHERNLETLLGSSPPPSERPSAPPTMARRPLSALNPENDVSSPVRARMVRLFKGVKELGSMLSDTVQVFRDNQRVLSGSNEIRILQVQTLLEKALRLNEAMRERSGIRLVTNFGEEPPIMMGEEGPLLSAILNLFINACHAMPNGGELRVRTSVENGIVTIKVEDTGIGIAEQNLPHIFEPHFTTKEHSGGTGMGLANVHLAIVRVHRGRISVRSEEGQGTTFELELPQTRSRGR